MLGGRVPQFHRKPAVSVTRQQQKKGRHNPSQNSPHPIPHPRETARHNISHQCLVHASGAAQEQEEAAPPTYLSSSNPPILPTELLTTTNLPTAFPSSLSLSNNPQIPRNNLAVPKALTSKSHPISSHPASVSNTPLTTDAPPALAITTSSLSTPCSSLRRAASVAAATDGFCSSSSTGMRRLVGWIGPVKAVREGEGAREVARRVVWGRATGSAGVRSQFFFVWGVGRGGGLE